MFRFLLLVKCRELKTGRLPWDGDMHYQLKHNGSTPAGQERHTMYSWGNDINSTSANYDGSGHLSKRSM